MINVFICEDNQNQLKLFEKYVRDAIIIEDVDMKVALVTSNPHNILKYIQSKEVTGLYFLDIDLHSDITGLELAQQIREEDPRCFIVFITSHSEMGVLTFQYKVEALDFIIKDDLDSIRSRIRECVAKAGERYSSAKTQEHEMFTISMARSKINIELDEILFFETSTNIHKIVMHAKGRKIEFNAQMKEIEEQLDDRFFRCHRSYLVNKDNIDHVDFTNCIIHMVNGELCLLAMRSKKGLR